MRSVLTGVLSPKNGTSEEGQSYVGRIAPSPTGHLHPGHASTFLIACERARERNGRLVLRIEDLDRNRCKEHFYGEMIEDMKWIGVEWANEGPVSGGLYKQSERIKLYEEAWLKLYRQKLIYPCKHSRKDVEGAISAPHEGDAEIIFPPLLRPDSADVHVDSEVTKPSEGPKGVNWRFRVPDGRSIEFSDNCQGEQAFTAGEDFGDFVIYTKDGYAAYELAVVVDDSAMGVTEVVRGADLLLSTARQLLLYEALNGCDSSQVNIPAFYHCSLVRDAQGKRMAKRTGDTTLRSLREAGWTPERVLQHYREGDGESEAECATGADRYHEEEH